MGQSGGNNSSEEALSFQVTPVCVKLKKLTTQPWPWFLHLGNVMPAESYNRRPVQFGFFYCLPCVCVLSTSFHNFTAPNILPLGLYFIVSQFCNDYKALSPNIICYKYYTFSIVLHLSPCQTLGYIYEGLFPRSPDGLRLIRLSMINGLDCGNFVEGLQVNSCL